MAVQNILKIKTQGSMFYEELNLLLFFKFVFQIPLTVQSRTGASFAHI